MHVYKNQTSSKFVHKVHFQKIRYKDLHTKLAAGTCTVCKTQLYCRNKDNYNTDQNLFTLIITKTCDNVCASVLVYSVQLMATFTLNLF